MLCCLSIVQCTCIVDPFVSTARLINAGPLHHRQALVRKRQPPPPLCHSFNMARLWISHSARLKCLVIHITVPTIRLAVISTCSSCLHMVHFYWSPGGTLMLSSSNCLFSGRSIFRFSTRSFRTYFAPMFSFLHVAIQLPRLFAKALAGLVHSHVHAFFYVYPRYS